MALRHGMAILKSSASYFCKTDNGVNEQSLIKSLWTNKINEIILHFTVVLSVWCFNYLIIVLVIYFSFK